MRRRKTNQLDMLPQAFRPLAHFWPAALRRFDLTPGDFAAVANQARFLPAANALELAQRLAAECSLKPESRRKIGFPAPSHIERPS